MFALHTVNKATSFDQVVEALVTNTEERTESVTLVFERTKGASATI